VADGRHGSRRFNLKWGPGCAVGVRLPQGTACLQAPSPGSTSLRLRASLPRRCMAVEVLMGSIR
jgi:hypothetical protein